MISLQLPLTAFVAYGIFAAAARDWVLAPERA